MRNGPNSGFTNDTLAKIEGTDVDVIVPDYCEDSDRPADIALSLWSEILDLSILGIDSEESYLRYKNLLFGYIFYRDFYLVGRMGAEMAKRANGSNAATGASLLVGRLHENIGTILQKMGVEVTAIGNRDNGHWSTKLMVDCVRRGAIRAQDAERLAKDET